MSNNITETRICVQKILPQHQQELKSFQSSGSQQQAQKLSAAFWTKKIWTKGSKITIGFLDNGKQIPKTSLEQLKISGKGKLDPLQNEVNSMSVQQMIRKIVRERIEPLVNLRLEFVDQNPENANVRISFDPNGGCWSLVGTDHLSQKDGATMNFGWFDVPTTIHEFGHMLGMIHEHQNPRGKQIKWNDSKVFAWAKSTQGWSEKITEQNIISKYNISTINGSDFDPLSVMLYFFPAELTTNGVGTQQNLRLSGLDVDWIYKTYAKEQGETPDQFYKNVYNDSLEKSVQESIKLAHKFTLSGPNSVNWKTIGTLLILFIFILAILKLVKFLRKNKRVYKYGK